MSAWRTNARQIDAGANYWAWQIAFNNRLRTGCTGCAQPTTILWQSLGIESNAGETSICLTGPDSAKGPDRAGINGGYKGDGTDQGCCHRLSQCCGVDTVRPTWGQIKALYR